MAELAFWIAAAALGTVCYRIFLPLAGVALLQGLAGAVGMAILSRKLLRQIKSEGTGATSLRETCATTAVTLVMHFYSGVMTASGVMQGLCGHQVPFERTPKKGGLVREMTS